MMMKMRVGTPLGDLTVFSNHEDWMRFVETLFVVSRELRVPLPKALYYGPSDYTSLLPPTDYTDRHLTYRGTSSIMEYWYRDQMILFFGSLEEETYNHTKALLAHELIHHLDNLDNLNITAYALPCAYFCNEDAGQNCVTYFKICLDAFRNTSVNSRLPPFYQEICNEDSLEYAREAMKKTKKSRDREQRLLALLYSMIVASSLIPFKKIETEAKDILKTALKRFPAFEEFSIFIQKSVQEISGKKPSIAIEETYIESLNPLLCSTMKQIFKQ